MSLRVWVVAVGEPLPTDAGEPRLLRAGIIVNMLAAAGHDVTWWTSNIDHTHKRRRFPTGTEKVRSPNLRIVLLDGTLYQSNVSLSRIRNHRQIAAAFRRRSGTEKAPDIILCSFPTVELTLEVTEYARKAGVSAIVDIRDLWPDAIIDLAPRPLRWIPQIAALPMRLATVRALKQATAIIAVTQEYRDWGLALANRAAGPLDRVFPLAYHSASPPEEAQQAANEFWRSHGVGNDPTEFNIAFFGYIGRQFDLRTVTTAARLLEDRNLPIRFILCGAGDGLQNTQQLANGLRNVLLPGWVNSSQIWSLMRHAQLGLAPYIDSDNFRKNIPNKIIEYFSAGLPVLTCLDGAAASLISANDVGYFYSYGSGQALANMALDAYSNRAVLNQRSDRARRLFEGSFSADQVYGEMIRFLQDMAHGPRTR